jgi:hypothetical protein
MPMETYTIQFSLNQLHWEIFVEFKKIICQMKHSVMFYLFHGLNLNLTHTPLCITEKCIPKQHDGKTKSPNFTVICNFLNTLSYAMENIK